jgi:hypothetical protein
MCHAMDGWMRVPATCNHRKARAENDPSVSPLGPWLTRESGMARRRLS